MSEKMSESGVNPHLEGIISDFEGSWSVFHSVTSAFMMIIYQKLFLLINNHHEHLSGILCLCRVLISSNVFSLCVHVCEVFSIMYSSACVCGCVWFVLCYKQGAGHAPAKSCRRIICYWLCPCSVNNRNKRSTDTSTIPAQGGSECKPQL